METGLIIAGLACLVVLVFKRWFWIAAFGTGCVAACCEFLIGITHFELLGAFGYFLLMLVCWSMAKSLAEAYPLPREKTAEELRLASGEDRPDWSPH